MNPSTDLTWLFGIVISILLSMVVYFVRLLHVDFRRMQKDIAEVKTTTQLIKSKFKGGWSWSAKGLVSWRPKWNNLRRSFITRFTMKKSDLTTGKPAADLTLAQRVMTPMPKWCFRLAIKVNRLHVLRSVYLFYHVTPAFLSLSACCGGIHRWNRVRDRWSTRWWIATSW